MHTEKSSLLTQGSTTTGSWMTPALRLIDDFTLVHWSIPQVEPDALKLTEQADEKICLTFDDGRDVF